MGSGRDVNALPPGGATHRWDAAASSKLTLSPHDDPWHDYKEITKVVKKVKVALQASHERPAPADKIMHISDVTCSEGRTAKIFATISVDENAK